MMADLLTATWSRTHHQRSRTDHQNTRRGRRWGRQLLYRAAGLSSSARLTGWYLHWWKTPLTPGGANAVALGDIRPDNTSLLSLRRVKPSTPPCSWQNRYLRTCEEVARIWAEFWVMKYGDRLLRVEDGDGVWYLPLPGRAVPRSAAARPRPGGGFHLVGAKASRFRHWTIQSTGALSTKSNTFPVCPKPLSPI